MVGFVKLALMGLALVKTVAGQASGTTDGNPAYVVTSVIATTNVVVVAVPYSTIVEGVTTVLTTEVPTTILLSYPTEELIPTTAYPTEVSSEVSSIVSSISSSLEEEYPTGTTLVTSTIEASSTTTTDNWYLISTGSTVVTDGSTITNPDVTVSTLESSYTSVVQNATTSVYTSTTTGTEGGDNATQTYDGEQPTETGEPDAGSNLKASAGPIVLLSFVVGTVVLWL